MDQLYHYSPTPLLAVRSMEQQAEGAMKPSGLWFSVGDGKDSWPAWCKAEEFALDRLAYRTRIVIAETARVLWIEDADGIDAIHARYGCTLYDGGRQQYLDWPSVARAYDGIVIAPYCWERRMDYLWYYGWDCASGCVWNANAVAALIPDDDGTIDEVRLGART